MHKGRRENDLPDAAHGRSSEKRLTWGLRKPESVRVSRKKLIDSVAVEIIFQLPVDYVGC